MFGNMNVESVFRNGYFTSYVATNNSKIIAETISEGVFIMIEIIVSKLSL